MGVAEDELFADAVGHGVQIEATGLLLHKGVEHHLEQHVAQLLLQVLGAALVDGLHGLIGLLQEIAADGLVGLLRVPGAPAGRPQEADNLLQVLDAVRILILKIYHISRPPATSFSKKLTGYAEF